MWSVVERDPLGSWRLVEQREIERKKVAAFDDDAHDASEIAGWRQLMVEREMRKGSGDCKRGRALSRIANTSAEFH